MPDQTEHYKHIFILCSVFPQKLDNQVFDTYEISLSKGIFLGHGNGHQDMIKEIKRLYFSKFIYGTSH